MASDSYRLNITDASLKPVYRRLRGYAFDPSFANRLDAFGINTIVYPIRWEPLLPGPVGEYIEVVDVDPASGVFYPPLDLSDPQLMAQDGLPPSESNPQFHQQMVYAVAMTTIQNFEKALGRPVQWSSTDYDARQGKSEGFVQHLRLYPHAIRDANAYYSSAKKAVLFGYFSARPNDESVLMPGSLVFTCLSHDIISHEVTHALIDGIYKGYVFPVHEDTLGLHEAFSDLVALFQHFTFPEVLESQIARTRGDLKGKQLLSELAQQFGLAVGNYSALRDAIGGLNEKGDWEPTKPDPKRLKTEQEPHARGSILVAAVFDAFLNIYKNRTADLNRIASDGTGILAAGEIHPDLVKRLAAEAARTAKQFLSLCIRALDYCPPIGTTFGEFLRGLITADVDLVPADPQGFRVALVESFKRWGIYPNGIRTLSVENLTYYPFTQADILGLTQREQQKRQDEQEMMSFSTNFFQKIDDMMMAIDYLPSDAQVFIGSEKGESKETKFIKLIKEYREAILSSLDSLKNELSTPPQGRSRSMKLGYFGEIKTVGTATSETRLESARDMRSAAAPVSVGTTSVDEEGISNGVNLMLLKFWFLMEHFYNETAGYLKNRKRLFLIAQEYKRRLHYLFETAPDEAKERLQSLIGVLFETSKYAALCAVGPDITQALAGTDLMVDRIYQPAMEPADKKKRPELSFRIDSLHRAQRVGPDTNVINQVVMTVMQRFQIALKTQSSDRPLTEYSFSGGCTLVVDIDQKTIRFIRKGVLDNTQRAIGFDIQRITYELRRRYRPDIAESVSPFAPSRWPGNDPKTNDMVEPFALLHQNE